MPFHTSGPSHARLNSNLRWQAHGLAQPEVCCDCFLPRQTYWNSFASSASRVPYTHYLSCKTSSLAGDVVLNRDGIETNGAIINKASLSMWIFSAQQLSAIPSKLSRLHNFAVLVVTGPAHFCTLWDKKRRKRARTLVPIKERERY